MDPCDEIVISGIAGRFPESDNMKQFRDNLMNKVDLVTDDDRRWKPDHPEIPRRMGKVNNLEKFDAIFFGVHFKQVNYMDPMCRMVMEHAYEAVVDAGANPRKLRGSKTGVFIAEGFSDSEKILCYKKVQLNGFGLTGCAKTMLANRISYLLGVTGPSYTIDTACSSTLVAMEQAFRAIRDGQCDAAIVGGVNICLHRNVSLQYARLGLLSSDGRCKVFDDGADGFARSETIGVIYLQKKKDAKRIYATLVYAKNNCDGSIEKGFSIPSRVRQCILLKQFYEECKIPPYLVSYLETNGTGIKHADIEELNAIETIFCPGRTEPLKIGSVKSNIGHAEAASGIGQIAKVLIACEEGVIPPNLHYHKPCQGAKALQDGKLQVVTEPTPWDGDYIAVSSFGLGGANAHILLKRHTKKKVNNGAPQDDLPRLVLASGRTEDTAGEVLLATVNQKMDVEFIRLLHEIHAENISGHFYRGYAVIGTSDTENKIRGVEHYPEIKRPIWFVFSGMGSQWPAMGASLLRLSVFENSIRKCDAVLKPLGIDIFNILTNPDKSVLDNILNTFVGITAVQIGLVDLLTFLGIVPDAVIGHSAGEVVCSYADGCFTTEQTILTAYYRGLATMESKPIKGTMAAVGLGYRDIKDMCPADIDIGCHNSSTSVTLSGPAESVKAFVAELTKKEIFAREVSSNDVAYHSRYIAQVGPRLVNYLKKVIPNPKPRSEKWFSTSVPKDQWDSPEAKLSSAEYQKNNLLSPVLFEEASALIPKDAVAIEIAPHALLQAILKRSLSPEATNISLTQRGHKDNIEVFLQGIGKLYQVGLHPEIWKLYPEVQFPVSRGTPMISPAIRWDHAQDWFVYKYEQRDETIPSGEKVLKLSVSDQSWDYVKHYIIDGKNIMPIAGYLELIWRIQGDLLKQPYVEVPVVFEDVKFLRLTAVPRNATLDIILLVQKGTGRFEVTENGKTVVTGFIRHVANSQQEEITIPLPSENEPEELDGNDVYKELQSRGYEYSGPFRSIKSANVNAAKGTIRWSDSWAAFMDGMMQMKILGTDTRNLLIPNSIQKLTIDPKKHLELITTLPDDNKELKVYSSEEHAVVLSGGVQIRGFKTSAISRQTKAPETISETYEFVAHKDRAETTLKEAIRLATHIAVENHLSNNVKTLESLEAGEKYRRDKLLSPLLIETLHEIPKIKPDVNVLTLENTFREREILKHINTIEPKKLNSETGALILAGRNLLKTERSSSMSHLLLALKKGGFVVTLETSPCRDISIILAKHGLHIVLEKIVNNSTFLLLRKIEKAPNDSIVIEVSSEEFTWVNSLKANTEHKSSESPRVLLTSDKKFENGLLGLVNSLRREPNGDIIRGILVQDPKAPDFSLSTPLYGEQINLDLAINVLRPQGTWGSYRHHRLPSLKPRPVHHAWANQLIKGNFSSFQWTQGPITSDYNDSDLVKVVYSSLNFKDVMLASGKLAAEAVYTSRKQETVLGFEFAGVSKNGRRVMGLVSSRAMSNLVIPDQGLTWTVPDSWSLEEAATVPCVYATCYYALHMSGRMKKGDKVLIHAGTGGVGQAAINLALWAGCEVFTTVGTAEKRAFLKKIFPEISDDHIGNSRDTSFEELIIKRTNGQGVDIVLNSLARDKLQSSLSCLARRGRFLEIGRVDMINDSTLGMAIFLKEVSFHGILLDKLFNGDSEKKQELHRLLQKGILEGVVKPLNRTVFSRDQIDSAFTYMATGKHTGKVLLKVQEEYNLDVPIPAVPRYYCQQGRSYVIVEGLEDLGLEVADWLVLRGAENIILVSHSGVKNGYQRMRIKLWESYGVKVTVISGKEASHIKHCEEILSEASKQTPVDAIYNFTDNVTDKSLKNSTPETFEESLRIKAHSTKNLDQVSRKLCPKLRHFVISSLLSSGHANTEQVNCGISNSVAERICEKRVADGLPALAIRWEVEEVDGEAHKNENLATARIHPQKILSCVHQLGNLLCQNAPIIVSTAVTLKETQ